MWIIQGCKEQKKAYESCQTEFLKTCRTCKNKRYMIDLHLNQKRCL